MSFGVTGLFGLVPFVCSASVVSTFKDVNRELSTRWAQHDVIGQKPTLSGLATMLFESLSGCDLI